MAEAGKKPACLGLPGEDAAQWPLQRYGRFVLLGAGESPGPGLDSGMASSPTWKVFDSSEESGHLILTIVISGHFFISQGQTLLEGFSLIGSKNWLKIVRRMDCLLFGTTIKDKSRMFRVQFGGETRQQALEHCDSCVRSLAQYVTIQTPEGSSQGPRLCPGPMPAADSRTEGRVQSVPLLPGSHQEPGQQWCMPAGTGIAGGRTSVTQLAQEMSAAMRGVTLAQSIHVVQKSRAQTRKSARLGVRVCYSFALAFWTSLCMNSLLASEELPLVYEQSAWNSEELGPFLRLCLMDQSFPAFVEQVEKELKKLTGFRN